MSATKGENCSTLLLMFLSSPELLSYPFGLLFLLMLSAFKGGRGLVFQLIRSPVYKNIFPVMFCRKYGSRLRNDAMWHLWDVMLLQDFHSASR